MNQLMVPQKEQLSRRCKLSGVPKEIWNPILEQFEVWVRSSGLEWAIARLKSVKVDLIRKRAGQAKASVWVKKTRNGTFSGPLGGLETYASRNGYTFSRAVALINLYTYFVFPKPTKAQVTKFLDGVLTESKALDPLLHLAVREGVRLAGMVPRQASLPEAKPLLMYYPIPTKRGPIPGKSIPEEQSVVAGIRFLSLRGGLDHLLRFWDKYKPVLVGLEPEVELLTQSFHSYGITSRRLPASDGLVVGRIGLIQEAGGKLRAVANPARVFQRVLEPLGHYLFGMLRHLPYDCTHNQSKADDAILRRLAARESVYSVDLTGATDYFPLDLQVTALNELLPFDRSAIDLFVEISRGFWEHRIPLELSDKLEPTLRWRTGQPLGLFPSFASFALTHGALLMGLLGKSWDQEFFILGDDVVILDDVLYERYREALSSMGCPVSASKTLVSTSVAEFRSRIYTDGKVIPQFKWRQISDESFIDIVRNQQNLYPLLGKRQKAVVDAISGIPAELGGLGWNPKGLPLAARLEPFWDLILGEDVPLSYVTDLTGLASRLLHVSAWQPARRTGAPKRELDFDQKSMELVRHFLGSYLVPLFGVLGRNLDSVVEGNLDLPLSSGRHQTTLVQWERVLRLLLRRTPDLAPLTAN